MKWLGIEPETPEVKGLKLIARACIGSGKIGLNGVGE